MEISDKQPKPQTIMVQTSKEIPEADASIELESSKPSLSDSAISDISIEDESPKFMTAVVDETAYQQDPRQSKDYASLKMDAYWKPGSFDEVIHGVPGRHNPICIPKNPHPERLSKKRTALEDHRRTLSLEHDLSTQTPGLTFRIENGEPIYEDEDEDEKPQDIEMQVSLHSGKTSLSIAGLRRHSQKIVRRHHNIARFLDRLSRQDTRMHNGLLVLLTMEIARTLEEFIYDAHALRSAMLMSCYAANLPKLGDWEQQHVRDLIQMTHSCNFFQAASTLNLQLRLQLNEQSEIMDLNGKSFPKLEICRAKIHEQSKLLGDGLARMREFWCYRRISRPWNVGEKGIASRIAESVLRSLRHVGRDLKLIGQDRSLQKSGKTKRLIHVYYKLVDSLAPAVLQYDDWATMASIKRRRRLEVAEAEAEAQPPSLIKNEMHRAGAESLPISPEYRPCSLLLQSASSAAPGSEKSFWTYQLYRKSDGRKPMIKQCISKDVSESTLGVFYGEKVLGFDMEWDASAKYSDGIKKSVSLIQIASEHSIALLHIARFDGDSIKDLVPDALRCLLEDRKVIKVGVSIKADCTRLERHLGIKARGILELSNLHKLVKYSGRSLEDTKNINKVLVPLRDLVKEHLGLPLKKDFTVRTGGWTTEMTPEQREYAASDAYACLQLFFALEAKRHALDPRPPQPAFAEHGADIRLANGLTVKEYVAKREKELERERLAEAESKAAAAPAAQPHDDVGDSSTVRDPADLQDALAELEAGEANEASKDSEDSATKGRAVASLPLRPGPSPDPATPPSQPSSVHREKLDRDLRLLRVKFNSSRRAKMPSPRFLTAYSLWHFQEQGLREVASYMKEPPLKPSTAAVYILEAILAGHLAYSKERLRELLRHAPQALREGKFGGLARVAAEVPAD